jgi:hypothetical protein
VDLIVESTIQFLIHHGYAVLFAWVLLEQGGLPIPAVPLLLAAGALAATGRMNLALIFGTAVLATLASDGSWYARGRRTVSYAVSQAKFTPEDTDRVIPDPTDRPYAGTLAFGLGLYVDQPNRYDGLRPVVGLVGPWAGARLTRDPSELPEGPLALRTSEPRGRAGLSP